MWCMHSCVWVCVCVCVCTSWEYIVLCVTLYVKAFHLVYIHVCVGCLCLLQPLRCYMSKPSMVSSHLCILCCANEAISNKFVSMWLSTQNMYSVRDHIELGVGFLEHHNICWCNKRIKEQSLVRASTTKECWHSLSNTVVILGLATHCW